MSQSIKRQKEQKEAIDKALKDDPDYCHCKETLLVDAVTGDLYRVKKPRWHSCNYIARVDLGSAMALSIAAMASPVDWQRTFAGAMDAHRLRVMQEMELEEAAEKSLQMERAALRLLAEATHEAT